MQINGVVGIALCSTTTAAAASKAKAAAVAQALESAAVFQLQTHKVFSVGTGVYLQSERSHNKVC